MFNATVGVWLINIIKNNFLSLSVLSNYYCHDALTITHILYCTVWVKKVAPPLKLFAIFSFIVNLCLP